MRRDTGAKEDLLLDQAASDIPALLAAIQKNLYEKAKEGRDEKVVQVKTGGMFVCECVLVCVCACL